METIHLKVEGMSCGSCVTTVEHALLGVPEVRAVQIDLPSGVASVTTERAGAGSAAAMIAAIGSVGYTAGSLQVQAETVAQPDARPEDSARGGCGCGSAGQRAGSCCGGR
jgi:copper chaperone CopZ